MKVFELINKQPVVTTEGIITFRFLYDRDNTPDKSVFFQEMCYIYFLTDYKSYYHSYQPEHREKEVIKHYIKISGWKPDAEIKKAIDIYKDLQKTESLGLLEDSRFALNKVREYWRSIDYNKRDIKGNQLYKPTEVTRSIGDISKMIESIDKLTDKVKREEEIGRKTRGDGEGSFFEDK